MSVQISKLAVLPAITVQKRTGGVYTMNPFTSTYDFWLQSGQYAPRYLNVAGFFDLLLHDPNSVMFDELQQGAEIKIWTGKTDATKQGTVLGMLVDYWAEGESQDEGYIRLIGPDWFSRITQNRLLNNFIRQKLTVDGTPDTTDTRTHLRNLYYEIMTNHRWYPGQTLSMEDQGISVSLSDIDIDPVSLSVSEFGASMEPAEQVFKRLDGLAYGAVHDMTFSKEFRVFIPQANPSGIILVDNYTDAEALANDQTKVGLISGPIKFGVVGEEYRKLLHAIGGSRGERDANLYQTGATTFSTTFGTALAQKIPASLNFNIRPQYIGVKLFRAGTLSANVTIELREDKAGEPKGTSIRTIDFDKDDINQMTAADWRYIDMHGEELNSKQDYWVIIYQNGDASNHARWYRDSGTSAINASSTNNGATWTINTSSYQFTLDYWFVNELRDSMPNDYNVIGGEHYFAEELVREPNLKDDLALSQLMEVGARQMFYNKHIFKGMIYSPDTLLENGQQVRIRVQDTPPHSFDYDDFIISGIEYLFDGAAEHQDGTMYYDITAIRIAD